MWAAMVKYTYRWLLLVLSISSPALNCFLEQGVSIQRWSCNVFDAFLNLETLAVSSGSRKCCFHGFHSCELWPENFSKSAHKRVGCQQCNGHTFLGQPTQNTYFPTLSNYISVPTWPPLEFNQQLAPKRSSLTEGGNKRKWDQASNFVGSVGREGSQHQGLFLAFLNFIPIRHSKDCVASGCKWIANEIIVWWCGSLMPLHSLTNRNYLKKGATLAAMSFHNDYCLD